MAKQKNIKDKANIYHKHYKRTGLYGLVWKNLLKVLVFVALLIAALMIINNYFDVEAYFAGIVEKLNPVYVYLFFFVSETLLGLIPPDIFIVWGNHFEHPYLIVTYLAILSYIGGFFSYVIGRQIRKIPSVNRYLELKFADNFKLIQRYGGLIIVISALLPLPYSTISMVAGTMRYNVKTYLLLGLTRFIRYYLYAVLIYSLKIF